jgi:hypothetical protein
MRAGLEAAMGRVMTSRRASDEFAADPNRFAATFTLTRAETASLIAMHDDLLDLMPGFVVKRRKSLVKVCRRTLSLLPPDERMRLLDEFCDDNPPQDQTRADWLAFANHLLSYLSTTRHERPDVVVDVATFDRARIQSMLHSRPLGVTPSATALDAFDVDRPLRFVAAARIDAYGRDLRAATRFDLETLLREPADPCTLVSFHDGTAESHRLMRLLPAVVAAVQTIHDTPGTTAAMAVAESVQPHRALNTLSRLVAAGAVQWQIC